MWRRVVAATAFVPLLLAGVVAAAHATSSLTGVRVGQHDGMTRLILDLTKTITFEYFSLSAPYRVVIDVPSLHWALDERMLTVGHSGIARLRHGQFRPDASRIVLDLDRPLAVRQAQVLAADAEGTSPHRLILDLARVSPSAFEAAARPPEPVTQARRTASAAPAPLPKLKPAPKTVRHLIAIDAGHGGRDPGAIAANGLKEKTLALIFARELRAVLRSPTDSRS